MLIPLSNSRSPASFQCRVAGHLRSVLAPFSGKAPAVVLSLLAVCAVLWPIAENWKQKPNDSFPLSYYPMFSKSRGESTQLSYLVGIDDRGTEHVIRYTYAGTGGFNQVRKQIRKGVHQGNGEQICRRVASRIARKNSGPLSAVKTVFLVTGTFRLDQYFAGNTRPESVSIEAFCDVNRPGK